MRGRKTQQGGMSGAGLYVYRTLTIARRCSANRELIIECEVDPKDLLHVSLDREASPAGNQLGSMATYRRLKPIAVHARQTAATERYIRFGRRFVR